MLWLRSEAAVTRIPSRPPAPQAARWPPRGPARVLVVVDRQIRNLRARLRDDWREPRYIVTVPGRGYRFLATATRSNVS